MNDQDYKTKTNLLLRAIPKAIEAGKLKPVRRIEEGRFSALCGDFHIEMSGGWKFIILVLRGLSDLEEIDRQEFPVTDLRDSPAENAYAAMRAKAMNADKAVADILSQLEALSA